VAGQPPTPGWHPDPGGQPDTQRWWDGEVWSHVTRPAPPGSAPARPAPAYGAGGAAAAGPSARALTTPDGVALSGLFRRLVARVLDWVLLSLLSFAAAYPFLQTVITAYRAWVDQVLAAADKGQPMPAFTLLQDVEVQSALRSYLLISVLVSGLYTIPLLKLFGGTLGKLVLGVRVRSWDDAGPLGWGQALARWLTGDLIGQVFVIFLLLDFGWPLWDPRRQALHDKLPGTVVVRAGRQQHAQLPVQAPWP
jgi:uncharacterized RDD family membrane protein YckC